MPTLRSLGVHPDWRERFFASEPSIETPQALLSRDPTALAKQLKVSPRVLNEIRGRVADALTTTTVDGRRALRIQAVCNSLKEESVVEGEVSLIVGSVSAASLLTYNTGTDHPQNICTTGCSSLDRLLATSEEKIGLQKGCITQFVGPPATGKTQIALTAAANNALNGGKVLYVASGYGHGTLLPLLRRLNHLTNRHTFHAILQNVAFVAVSDGYKILAELSKLESRLLDAASLQSPPCTLLILDSASGCLAANLYSSGDDTGLKLIRDVSLQLKRLSRYYPLPILVTNGTANGGRPAMGQAWKKAADLSLQLDILSDSSSPNEGGVKTIRASLTRHPTKVVSGSPQDEQTASFVITSSGIADSAT